MLRLASTVVVAGLVLGGAACSDSESGSAPDGDSVARSWEPEVVKTEACPESRFECVTLTVPRDHFDDGGDTWEVTYAIQPAAVEQRGTFVTITGGPGSGGIYSADGYTDVMASQITDYYDIVFFNQRGSGDFKPVRCDEAATAFYQAPLDVESEDAVDEIDTVLRTFVDDCMAEGEIDVDDLAYYSTRQAVEDLEAVRRHLGVDQMMLYGESYGTQFVQTYAAAHPDRVAALMIDGVVDLTIDGLTWYHEAARAYDDALVSTFAACALDEVCAADADADDSSALEAAYDELADQLADGPIEFEFPMPDGSTLTRELTSTDLEIAASGNVGDFNGRMHLLRVLNAAADGNYVPLDRMADQYLYIDPETQDLIPDPSWSDALYYAVECQDYSIYAGEGTSKERLAKWLDDFTSGDDDELRLGGVALGDLPCLYWPSQPGEVERPEPILDPPYPTFVLTADTDAATPTVSAMRVFSRLDDAYLVVLQGGPHVIFDWGYPCVDDLISNYLGSGELPATKVTICDGDVIDPYVAVAPIDAADVESAEPVDVAAAVADQVSYNVEYWLWPGDDVLEFGCDFGGTATYAPTDEGTDVTLDACEFTDGYPVTATGSFDADGILALDITTPEGELSVTDDGETTSVNGTWNDQPVDE